MPNPDFQDRRIFARFPAKFSLRFIDLFSNKEGVAQAEDVSAKGLGMVTSEALAPLSPLEMWLMLPGREESFYTRGNVVWSETTGSKKFRAGISLEKAELLSMVSRLSQSI